MTNKIIAKEKAGEEVSIKTFDSSGRWRVDVSYNIENKSSTEAQSPSWDKKQLLALFWNPLAILAKERLFQDGEQSLLWLL